MSVPLYFGTSGDSLFGWYHPAGGTLRQHHGILLCNPIGDDYIRAHRTLRHLAEQLSLAGFAVLRFDFHGTGDSSGSEHDPHRVTTWLGDISKAIEELKTQSGVSEVSLIGLRLGATVAAMAASQRDDVSKVVLWNPFPNGHAFVTETTKQHKMHKMLEPQSFAAGPQRYAEGEEALGFFLTQETIEDLNNLDILSIKNKPARNVLVIGSANIPAEQGLIDHLKSLEADVTYRHFPGHKFLISIPHRSTVPHEILEALVSWLGEARQPGATPSDQQKNSNNKSKARAIAPSVSGVIQHRGSDKLSLPLEEQPFRFGTSHPLFGILCKPNRAQQNTKQPAIIMLNAGCVHRIGPHRFYVTMARTWANLGFFVFRMDLSGIGDSPAAEGCEENLCYPRDGLDDVQQAMGLLQKELHIERFIVTGLCSGADIAFQIGFKDSRVASAIMMNPRTFCVHDLALVEAYKGARYYQDSFFRKESWAKLLKGNVNVSRIVKMLAPKVKGVAVHSLKSLVQRAGVLKNGGSKAAQTKTTANVPACLQMMAERGVDTFLVATEHDPGVDFVDVHFGKRMQALSSIQNFRRQDIQGTDHTFTSVWSQQHVCNTITEHLTQRYPV